MAVVIARDPCDGTFEIESSGWYMVCPPGSSRCGDGAMHFWGAWPGCCCNAGTFWDEVVTPGSLAEGMTVCQSCGSDSQPHPVPDWFEEEWQNLEKPWWWPTFLARSPLWLRNHCEWMFIFSVIPMALRYGIFFTIGSVVCKKFLKFNPLDCGSVMNTADHGVDAVTSPGLQPGMLAWKGSVTEPPREITEGDIRAHQAAVGSDMEQPLVPADKIIPVDPDITWMTFNEYYLALGWNYWFMWFAVVAKLVGWHLMQCVSFIIAYLAFYDLMDPTQSSLACCIVLREIIYFGLLMMSLRPKTCKFLLYWPFKDESFYHIQFPMFVLQPAEWLLWLNNVDMPKNEPESVYALLMSLLFTLDCLGSVSFFCGLWSGTLYWPMFVTYAVSMSSVCLFIYALSCKFFEQQRPRTGKDKWINIGRAQKMRSANKSIKDVIRARISVEEAQEAGYTRFSTTARDWHEAGIALEDLRKLGFADQEAKNGGYTANDFREDGHNLAKVLELGFTKQEAKNGGYTASDFRRTGYNFATVLELGFTKQQAKNGGYTARNFREDGCTLAQVVLELGFTKQEAKDGGYTARNFREDGCTLAQVVLELGFTKQEAKDGGYTASNFREAGCSLAEVLELGFTTQEATDGGYSASDFRVDRCKEAEVLDLGFVKHVVPVGVAVAVALSFASQMAQGGRPRAAERKE